MPDPHDPQRWLPLDLVIDVHLWLPGEPIPYDTMRAILGLPDVKREVERERSRREAAAAWARLSDRIKAFDEAFAVLTGAARNTTGSQADYTLAADKDTR